MQTTEATADGAEMTSLTEQITLLAARVAGMEASPARINEEIKLRALRRDLEKLQDEQLRGAGNWGAFRRRELDAAQRQLSGFQDCQTQVQARHDALPA